MSQATFSAALHAVLGGRTPPPAFQQRLDTLTRVAQSLERELTAGPPPGQSVDLHLSVEPGHNVNQGQQFNVACRIPSRHFNTVLFRAYIPDQGDPVHFDFYGEQMVVANGDKEMEDRVLDFVRNPDVVNRLLALRQMATR